MGTNQARRDVPSRRSRTSSGAEQVPADWGRAIATYVKFRSWPSWRGRDEVDGKPAKDHLEPDEREKLKLRLARSVGEACTRRLLPPAVHDVEQRHVDEWLTLAGIDPSSRRGWAAAPPGIKEVWRMIILDRCEYTCRYCGRNAEQTYRKEHRTLRLELDHEQPRSKGGSGWSLVNIVAACRSCNLVKGQMPPDRLRAELRSLAQAVMSRGAPSR